MKRARFTCDGLTEGLIRRFGGLIGQVTATASSCVDVDANTEQSLLEASYFGIAVTT